jgi:hypothetical protein
VKYSNRLATILGVAALIATPLWLAGCSEDDNNNGSQQGQMMMIMHDAPVDDFTEVWVTVDAVTMIGATGEDEIILDAPIRMDLKALDSVSQVLAVSSVNAATYSKIRLEVSNPEFVRDDDSVFSGDDIQLVANGHIDLNAQGGINIAPDSLTVVSLDFDLNNSIQIVQTGQGRYILRPQVFIDANNQALEPVTITGATVVSVNVATHTVIVDLGGPNEMVVVKTDGGTAILGIGGLSLGLEALVPGAHVSVTGILNVSTGVVTADTIQVTL